METTRHNLAHFAYEKSEPAPAARRCHKIRELLKKCVFLNPCVSAALWIFPSIVLNGSIQRVRGHKYEAPPRLNP
jgi:hypothetical protein